jgi:hypothetical protein
MGAGWLLTIRGGDADVELEQLDEAGLDWFATGPRGDAAGTLAEVVPAAVAADPEPIAPSRLRLVAKNLDRKRWPAD